MASYKLSVAGHTAHAQSTLSHTAAGAKQPGIDRVPLAVSLAAAGDSRFPSRARDTMPSAPVVLTP